MLFSVTINMKQSVLKLPFTGKLLCSQSNESEKNRTHYKKYENTRYALDFTIDGKKKFEIKASADGIANVWKCCEHKNDDCKCGLGFGNQIRIYHKNGNFTFYSHLSKIFVISYQKVRQGEVIGFAGKTGLAGNVHLHWTLGKESKESKPIEKKFIPFWSIKAEKIEIIESGKKRIVSSKYFKEGKQYESTN